MTLDEALAQQRGMPKTLSIKEALSMQPTVSKEGLRFDVGPSDAGIDVSTPQGRMGQGLAQMKQRVPSDPERFVMWALRAAGKYGPYLLAGEGGAALGAKALPELPVLGRLLGSAFGQGGVAGVQAGSPKAGLEAGGAALATEGLLTRFGARSALKRGLPRSAVGGTLEQGTPGRIGEMFGKVTPAAEADVARGAAQATSEALATKSTGRLEAEAAMAFRDTMRQSLGMGPAVNTAPLKQALLDQIHEGATLPERQALNQWLTDRADAMPSQMTHEQLDLFIREWTATIKSTYGKAGSDIAVPQAARRTVADTGRALRDRMMPEAAPSFASAERYLDSTKTLRKMLVDSKGNVKPTAPGVWRQALENDVIMQRLRAFDSATGNNVTERGLSLARKKLWTSKDGQEAIGILRLSSSPSPVVSVRTPSAMSKLAIAGSRPAGSIASRVVADRHRESQEPAPESMFPGMTSAGSKTP